MKQAIKGALLSGLIFPGLGQLALKRPARGLIFLSVALASTIYVVKSTVDTVMSSLATLDDAGITNLPTVSGGHAGLALWVFCLCWLWGVVDAYRIGAKLDQSAKETDKGLTS